MWKLVMFICLYIYYNITKKKKNNNKLNTNKTTKKVKWDYIFCLEFFWVNRQGDEYFYYLFILNLNVNITKYISF